MSNNKHFYITTLGCKLNQYESESISFSLIKSGYLITKDVKKADIIIINTCTVTTKADAKCRNNIRKCRKQNKDAVIIVCGCLVNTDVEKLKEMNKADIFIENKDKDKIYDIINIFINNDNLEKPFIYKSNYDGTFNYDLEKLTSHARAFLKIQDGCDNYCSYCKIPFARGKSRSKNYDKINNQINKLIENNYEEIVLTGVNIGSYNYNKKDFSDLLNELTDNFKNVRFRISSIEPQYIDRKFLNVLLKKNVCPHLHIPLQSGSNKILKLMNRKYNLEFYEEKINFVREVMIDPFISTDLILGFPGEDENDFENMKQFVLKMNFSFIHLFGFSPREGTTAYNLIPKIPERIRDKRINIIKDIVIKNNYEYRKKQIGKELNVIIERKKEEYYTGKSENYLDVNIITDKQLEIKKNYNILIKEINLTENIGILK